jgi:hypothetical protein
MSKGLPSAEVKNKSNYNSNILYAVMVGKEHINSS